MIYIGNMAHQSGPDPAHPVWDSMIALRNVEDHPVTYRIMLVNDEGGVIDWPGAGAHYDVTVEPGLMWAASFIPGNGFASPPQDWRGTGTVQGLAGSPFQPAADPLGFFLCAFNQWSTGDNAPYKKDPPVPAAMYSKLLWGFAYAIPWFDDSAGATAKKWLTGVILKNHEARAVHGQIIYTVGQNYAEKGRQYVVPFTVGPLCSPRFFLFEGGAGIPGLKDVGLPAQDTEGHIDIVLDEKAIFQPSLLIADESFSFQVTEEESY